MATRQDEDDRLIRTRVGVLADEWRAIARGTPRWIVDGTGDHIVLRMHATGEVVVTLHGGWAPNIAQFLAAMGTDAGCALAELLWRIGGFGGSVDIRDAAVHLLRHLGLEQPKQRHRRG